MNRPDPRCTAERACWARRFGPAILVPLAFALVATAAAPAFVRIRPGDTLWDLSRRYGTSVEALRRLNHLPGDTIYAGRTLRITGASPATAGTGRYRVRAGDTVSALALRFRVPIALLAADNHLGQRMTIYIGQTLRVRGAHRSTAAADHGPDGTLAGTVAYHRRLLAARGTPDRATVRAIIRHTAADLGVDPALALALAQQESGFRQNVVSRAGAIGVMQVLPSTGRWLSVAVVGRPLDLLRTRDNIIAGVSLLRVLTNAAPLRQAVAGYYQGLASVRRNGMYADTRRYVSSVLALRQRWR
jgi:soluble lytic murein transglycosylase-like protein